MDTTCEPRRHEQVLNVRVGQAARFLYFRLRCCLKHSGEVVVVDEDNSLDDPCIRFEIHSAANFVGLALAFLAFPCSLEHQLTQMQVFTDIPQKLSCAPHDARHAREPDRMRALSALADQRRTCS